MALKIDQDHARFRDIVKGRIRDNLKRYISHGELIGRQGKDAVSIPIPQIDIPRIIRLNQAGRVSFAGIITHEFRLDSINAALDLVRSGNAGRVLIDLGQR